MVWTNIGEGEELFVGALQTLKCRHPRGTRGRERGTYYRRSNTRRHYGLCCIFYWIISCNIMEHIDKWIKIDLLLIFVLYLLSMITLIIHLTKQDNMVIPTPYSRVSNFCFLLLGILSANLGQTLYIDGVRFGYRILDSNRHLTGVIFFFVALFLGIISIKLIRYRFKRQKSI